MKEQSEDPETDEEELNVTSAKFNPLKALYSKKFQVPHGNVRKFDNVSSFLSTIKQAGGELDVDVEKALKKSKMKDSKPNTGGVVDAEKFHVTEAGRTFLKEQGELTQPNSCWR